MITRRALLISNPGELDDEHYSEGVFVDIKNYTNYLTSPLGGAWIKSEIISLNRPSVKQLDDEILQMSSYDYTLILFAGHGYYLQENSYTSYTMLVLRKNEKYDERDLRKLATKRTIILDCCREIHIVPAWDSIMMEAMKKVAKRALNSDECRKYYDAAIAKCLKGVIVGHSCSPGETSGDDPLHGGHYASSLLKAAKDWHDQNYIDITTQSEAYSIVKAHNYALPLVGRLSGGTQNPYMVKPRSEPYFPFAIMA